MDAGRGPASMPRLTESTGPGVTGEGTTLPYSPSICCKISDLEDLGLDLGWLAT